MDKYQRISKLIKEQSNDIVKAIKQKVVVEKLRYLLYRLAQTCKVAADGLKE